MPSFTLLELRDQVRTIGDYANSSVMTDAFVTDSINKALAELYELVTDTFQGYYTTTANVVTVAGVQNVALPTDFYALRALHRVVDSERFAAMRRVNLIEADRYSGQSTPVAYMLWGGTAPGTIRCLPIPDGVYTLRVTYDPLFLPLVADEDAYDFRNGWEELVIQLALLRLDQREERPLGDRMAVIERHKARIIGSAFKRDESEPEYLEPRRGSNALPWEW